MTAARLSAKLSMGHANRIAHNGLSMAPMADLRGHSGKTCQYFVLDRVMCGEPGFPYCPEHHAVCYTTSPEPFIPGKSKVA